MQIRFDQERKLFTSQKKPVYVCHGTNEFLQKELASKIIRFLLPEEEEEMGLLRFDGSEINALDAIADAASVPSLFANTQVLLVYNAQNLVLMKNEEASSKKKLTPAEKYKNFRAYEKLIEAITAPAENIHIIFLHEDALRRTTSKDGKSRSEKVVQRGYADMEKYGVIIEFPRMFDNDIAAWARGRAARLGIKWSADLAEMFVEWAGNDIRHISNELEKLATHFSDDREITERDMRRLITSNEDFYVNYLVDFTLARRAKAALRMLDHSLERGSHPVFILSVITARLRQLWQARYLIDKGYFSNIPDEYGYNVKQAISHSLSKVSKEDASALPINPKDSILKKTPFALFHIFKPAGNFSIEEIENAISRASDIDRRLKGIQRPKHGSDKIMLQSLVVDIAKGVTGVATPN